MELNEKLDQKYNKDKSAYEKLSKLKERMVDTNNKIKQYTRAKQDAEMKKQRAIEDKDKVEEQNADAAIKLAEEEIKKLKANVQKMQQIISSSKEKVDSYITELSKDPEFKAHINSILEKRYNRRIKKYSSEKEQVDIMIKLVAKHPSLENNLKGIIRAQEDIKKLEHELKGLDPVKDKARIDEINNTDIPSCASKKSKNQKIFMDFCKKNNIKIDEEFLNKLIAEQGFSHTKDGDIRVSKSLKNISKGYDKRINAYEKAIQKIPGAKVYEENVERRDSTDMINDDSEEQDQDNHPAKKFKWWEFRKRFKDWKERRSVKKQDKKAEKEGVKPRESSEKFRNAYKYNVVKDYVDNEEKAIFKEAAKEMKQSNRDDNQR